MVTKNAEPFTALVMSHDAKDFGGVGNYLAIMKRRLRPATRVHRFVSGRRHGEAGKLDTAKRLIGDYIRFFFLMMRRRFDIVHFNPEMDLRSFPRESVFMFLLVLMRQPYVVFHHGWNWDELKIILSRPIQKRWLFFHLKRAGRVIVCSRSFRDALIENGLEPDRVVIITTMFDGDLLNNQDTAKDLHLENPRILFMARFVKEKGVYELIESVKLLKDEFPGLKLVMGGAGAEDVGMRAFAKEQDLMDNVIFPGYIRRNEKAKAFADATIFILPSNFWEGLPNAAIEAMGSGLPIISTKVAGLPEVMDDPDNGIFLEKVTPEHIAEAIRKMLRDPDYLRETSKRNSEKAWRNYESAIVSRQIEAVYHAALDKSAPPKGSLPELSQT